MISISTTLRRLCLIASMVSAGIFVGSVSAQTRGLQNVPTNVLFIYPDQHMHSVMGVAGDKTVLTPNLDRLALGGVRFTRFAVNHPVCTPSRASIQTGYYANLHGVFRNNLFLDVPDTTYLAEVFVEGGFVTGYAGKWHLDGGSDEDGNPTESFRPRELSHVPAGERRRGYEEWLGYEFGTVHDDAFYWDDRVDPPEFVNIEDPEWELTFYRQAFLEFAGRHGTANQPWMYFLSVGPPHTPNKAPKEFLNLYDEDTLPLPEWITQDLNEEDLATARNKLYKYYAMISFVDDEVGEILDGLEALGQLDNTLIVYTSDHGDLLGSHWDEFDNEPIEFRRKDAPYSNSFRVPLLMHWPAVIPPALEVDELISTVDIAPTVLSLAGLPIPPRMQGVDMSEWAQGGLGPSRDAIYLSLEFIERKNWIAIWTGDALFATGKGFHSLYDLANDPYEETNLFDLPEWAELQGSLEARLNELHAEALIPGDGAVESSGGLCFIATAAYGSPLAAELDGLRAFRDTTLLSTAIGRAFADTYYRASPPAADWIAIRPVARGAVRFLLGFVLVPNLYAWIDAAAWALLLTVFVRRYSRRNVFPRKTS